MRKRGVEPSTAILIGLSDSHGPEDSLSPRCEGEDAMSQKVVAEIINKALADGSLRRRLSSDPNAVLAGYDLTQDEVEAIRLSLDAGASAAPASDLDPRISGARLPPDALSHLFAPAGHESTGAIPEPIPHPGEGPHPIGAIPEPIPRPGEGPHPIGNMAEPVANPVYAEMKAMLDQVNQERADHRAGLHGRHGTEEQGAEAAIPGKAREVSEGREGAESQFGAAIIAGTGSVVAGSALASSAAQGPAPEHVAGVHCGVETAGIPGAFPHSAVGQNEAGTIAGPILCPGEGSQATSAMPEPIPHPAQGPEGVGSLPIPIPHEAQSPQGVGAMPEPIPHPVHGPDTTGAMPEPIPHVANSGATEVGSSPVPQPLPHEARPAGGAVDSPLGHADAIPIRRPEAGLHGPGGDAGQVASSAVPQPVPQPAETGAVAATDDDAPAGEGDRRPTPPPPAEDPFQDEPVQA